MKTTIGISETISLGVMLLMLAALAAGQVAAGDESAATRETEEFVDRFQLRYDGQLQERAVRVLVDVVAEPGYFRGEDE